MRHFWIIFILQEATTVLAAYVSTTGLTDAQKTAITKVVLAAQEALAIL